MANYYIYTVQDFLNITDNTGNFYLMNDLDFAGLEATFVNINGGLFEGNNYAIKNVVNNNKKIFDGASYNAIIQNVRFENITINGAQPNIGIFGNCGTGVSFKKIAIHDVIVNVDKDYPNPNNIGILFSGGNPSILEDLDFLNCSIQNQTENKGSWYGICGGGRYDIQNGDIKTIQRINFENCYIDAQEQAGFLFGRIQGYNGTANISNVKCDGSIVGGNAVFGANLAGLVGYIYTNSTTTVNISKIITNLYNLRADRNYAAGIVGYYGGTADRLFISDCVVYINNYFTKYSTNAQHSEICGYTTSVSLVNCNFCNSRHYYQNPDTGLTTGFAIYEHDATGYFNDITYLQNQFWLESKNFDFTIWELGVDGFARVKINMTPTPVGELSYVKVDGTWRQAEKIYVKIDGLWKEAETVYVKKDGLWLS